MNESELNFARAEARHLFPNIPEEVFQLWLDGRIEANGWPPTTQVWKAALGNRSIAFWQSLTWSKKIVRLIFDHFSERSRLILQEIFEACAYNAPNRVNQYMGDQSSRKYVSLLKYIVDNHQMKQNLPKPPILLLDGNFYEIADGNHRLSLFFFFRSQSSTKDILDEEQLVWIGERPTTGS